MMNFMEMGALLSARDEEVKNSDVEDIAIFEMRDGRFAHRKGWNSHTKSICSAGLFKSDDFHYEEDDNHNRIGEMQYVLTGVELGKFYAYKPTEEDMLAEDWEVCDVSNCKKTML